MSKTDRERKQMAELPVAQSTAGQAGEAGEQVVVDDVAARAREVYLFTERLMGQVSDWIIVFREIFGPDGVARRYFPTSEEMEKFEQTLEYRAIRQFIAQVREQNSDGADGKVATRMITVRIPKSLHDSLRVEAHERRTSMNKLCIWKLVQTLEDD